jgi:predicted O-methyltransferase YrrM
MPWYGSHSFLNEYIRKNNCKRIMEIGVLNGDNARRMVEVAMLNFPPDEVEYYGFDFFVDYTSQQVGQKLEKTGCKFKLFKGDTLDTLPEAVRTLPKMDLIFIDGGKSFTEAKSDWENSRTLMHDETAVFVHNYEFSGVRRMVDSIPQDKYQVKIIHPSSEGQTALIKRRLATKE